MRSRITSSLLLSRAAVDVVLLPIIPMNSYLYDETYFLMSVILFALFCNVTAGFSVLEVFRCECCAITLWLKGPWRVDT